MCFAGFGGMYALVSIVWFAVFYMTGAVPLVFLLDSCLESIARIDLCRESSVTHCHPHKTLEGFLHILCLWLACVFHAWSTSGILGEL